MTSTFTAEFKHEWEREREHQLRRRFQWYGWTLIGLTTIVVLVGAVVSLLLPQIPEATGGELNEQMSIRFELSPQDAAEPTNGEALSAPPVESTQDGEGVQGPDGEAEPTAASLALGDSRADRIERTIRVARVQAGIQIVAGLITIGSYLWGVRYVRQRTLNRDQILRVAVLLIMLNGVLGFTTQWPGFEAVAAISPEAFLQLAQSGTFASLWINIGLGTMLGHLLASFFLPWTPRESLAPIWPLLYMNTVFAAIVSWDSPGLLALNILLAPVFAVPGTLVAWWKHSRFHAKFMNRALRDKYGKLRRELVDARGVHEDLFPEPISDGPVRLRVAYTPAHHIGGDYVFARRIPPGPADGAGGLCVVVIDVTGHGVRAALTVNRIHGEIERLLATKPDAGPADILEDLNAYLHVTVSNHSVFATALAMHADVDAGVLRWASAGHPPAFMRTHDNRVFHLGPTGIVLGAVDPEEFRGTEDELPFAPGDTIIAYTDGAIECRDRSGEMLRLQGLEAMVASAPIDRAAPHAFDLAGELAQRLLERCPGPAEDDTLIVQISRPLPHVASKVATGGRTRTAAARTKDTDA
jgi:serine phosphatase RsbU (regulator of sigma subunit)